MFLIEFGLNLINIKGIYASSFSAKMLRYVDFGFESEKFWAYIHFSHVKPLQPLNLERKVPSSDTSF